MSTIRSKIAQITRTEMDGRAAQNKLDDAQARWTIARDKFTPNEWVEYCAQYNLAESYDFRDTLA